MVNKLALDAIMFIFNFNNCTFLKAGFFLEHKHRHTIAA